jgi:predicted MFS family arabinose efflux permease
MSFPGKIMNVLGRKRSLLFISLISLGGWILLATATHIIVICIARFISGWVAACNGLIGKKTIKY